MRIPIKAVLAIWESYAGASSASSADDRGMQAAAWWRNLTKKQQKAYLKAREAQKEGRN